MSAGPYLGPGQPSGVRAVVELNRAERSIAEYCVDADHVQRHRVVRVPEIGLDETFSAAIVVVSISCSILSRDCRLECHRLGTNQRSVRFVLHRHREVGRQPVDERCVSQPAHHWIVVEGHVRPIVEHILPRSSVTVRYPTEPARIQHLNDAAEGVVVANVARMERVRVGRRVDESIDAQRLDALELMVGKRRRRQSDEAAVFRRVVQLILAAAWNDYISRLQQQQQSQHADKQRATLHNNRNDKKKRPSTVSARATPE